MITEKMTKVKTPHTTKSATHGRLYILLLSVLQMIAENAADISRATTVKLDPSTSIMPLFRYD